MLDIALPTGLASVSTARRLVREIVATSANPELADDAALLTSEVVTNALLHGRSPVRIAVSVGMGVRIEVSDCGPRDLVVREHGALATSGRGLTLLDLLARWGVVQTDTGKAVWFELGETRARPGGAAT
ncbi:ATP-binding protein [Nocardioides sp. HDW12B]|uniref:ATP-binding protein n=1 Tax=Nocardioides sp. HDW12B TaxID=2714939 RepID=UPI00140DE8D6|nr:ATP-binding protein [Nocardioides sp. HDW12B]QIK65730.1 ATP-binding protein [Nocardioides sp. HDW12B]